LTVILKIMYLKPFKNFTNLVMFQNRASSPLWRKQTKRWSPLKAAFVTWTFRLPPVFFWTFSFHLQKLHVFFLKFKTSVLSNNRFAILFEETFFSKTDDGHAISRQERRRLPKSTAWFPAKKKNINHPPLGCLAIPLPLPQSLYACTYTDVATKISRIDRLPNFLSNGAPL